MMNISTVVQSFLKNSKELLENLKSKSLLSMIITYLFLISTGKCILLEEGSIIYITKTYLFKYTENFTTKKMKIFR